jgi:hypothetical protein
MRKIITIMLRVLPFVKSFATTRRNPSVSICQRAVAYTRTLRSRLFSSASLKLDDSKTRLISFVTDIEGDGLYFDRFVNNSTILDFEEVEPNLCPHAHDYFPYEKRVVFLPTSDDNEKILESEAKTVFNTDGIHMTSSILVCGGDMWDKGGNDLYVLRQMLSLQERYEGRVHFVMGNRDINKMRVLQELGITSKSSAQSLPLHGGVYWFKDTGLQGDPELIRKHLRMDEDGIQDDGDSYSILVPNSPPERLRWILKKSMGSPDAFEFRRNELKQEKEFLMSYEARDLAKAKQSQARLPAVVSDVEVVESYRTSCHPKGIMGKYLARSKLCLRIGCAMFMHGSLPITPTVLSTFEENGCNDNFNEKKAESFWSWFYTHTTPFRVKKSSAQGPVSTDEWVNILNAFAKSQFDAWKNSVTLAEEGVFGNSDGKHGEYWSSVGGYQTNDNSTELGIQFGSLCQYGMGWLPDKQQNPTVVYNSWLKDGLPRNLYEKNHDALSYQRLVKDFFNTSGLDVIVTGHQPGKRIFIFTLMHLVLFKFLTPISLVLTSWWYPISYPSWN